MTEEKLTQIIQTALSTVPFASENIEESTEFFLAYTHFIEESLDWNKAVETTPAEYTEFLTRQLADLLSSLNEVGIEIATEVIRAKSDLSILLNNNHD